MSRILTLVFIFGVFQLSAQSLLSMLDSIDTEIEPVYVSNTFKSVRLINGYNSDIAGKNDLVFSISHRFGSLNSGIYDLFGLDQSVIRFGFEYGLNDRISLGFGRSNFEKLYDGFYKIRLVKQKTNGFPLNITLLEGISIKTVKWSDASRDYPFSARMYYVHELFISRKVNSKFSLQVAPVLVHRNMVSTKAEKNMIAALGFGANYTVNKWLSFSGEYYVLLNNPSQNDYVNSAAIGIELESGGGHIFQIHISNSEGMTEKAFIPETTGRWRHGEVGLGFNIIRVFHLKNKR